MNLTLNRYSSNVESTLGLLYINNKFECYTLEDEKREIKKRGETRIPAGLYDIRFREVMSGMTEKYREKYSFFSWHLHLINVPGFEYIYIHAGNTDKDTDGCILVGDIANNNSIERGSIAQSRQAFQRIYNKISIALKNETVNIIISDRDGDHDTHCRH